MEWNWELKEWLSFLMILICLFRIRIIKHVKDLLWECTEFCVKVYTCFTI